MKAFITTLRTPLLIIALLLGLNIVHAAWSGPSATPPGNNVSAPVNTGGTDQVKNGGLGVNSLAVYGNASVQNTLTVNEICLNGVCRTQWDSVAQAAACGDGTDNDGDGLIDLNDPGCSSSSDDSEYNAPSDQSSASSNPRNLTANPGDGQISLSWSQPSDPGTNSNGSTASIDSYNLLLQRNGSTVGSYVTSNTSYTFTGLTNGDEYSMQAQAYNSANLYSGWSGAVTATPAGAQGETVDAGFNSGGGPTLTAVQGESARYDLWVSRTGGTSNPPIKIELLDLAVSHTCGNFPNCGPGNYYTSGISSKPIIIIPAANATPGSYSFSFKVSIVEADGTVVSSKTLPATLVVEEAESYVLGDVNRSGSVSAADSSLVQQYLGGSASLDAEQRTLADVTGNGSISYLDSDIILEYVAGNVASLPFSPEVGDVSLNNGVSSWDASMVFNHVDGSAPLSQGRQELADANGDGSITNLDADVILERAVGNIASLPFTIPYGDVSLNGSVNSYDASLVFEHAEAERGVSGRNSLSVGRQEIADANSDGQITELDGRVISQYVVRITNSLPDSSYRYGDVSLNGSVSSYDASLIYDRNNNPLSQKADAVADVNEDGTVNDTDGQLIQQYVTGQINSFPAY